MEKELDKIHNETKATISDSSTILCTLSYLQSLYFLVMYAIFPTCVPHVVAIR